MSLDRVHQELNLCLWGYPPGLEPAGPRKGFFLTRFSNEIQFLQDILLNTSIFLVKFFCKKTFDNTGKKHIIHFIGLPVVF